MKRGILESLGSSSFSLTCMTISPEEYICAPDVHLVPYETRRKH